MFKNYTDPEWIVPKLLLAAYAFVILIGAIAGIDLLVL